MRRKASITRIDRTFYRLRAEGTHPTVDAIRQITGGSTGTINSRLQVLRGRRSVPARIALDLARRLLDAEQEIERLQRQARLQHQIIERFLGRSIGGRGRSHVPIVITDTPKTSSCDDVVLKRHE